MENNNGTISSERFFICIKLSPVVERAHIRQLAERNGCIEGRKKAMLTDRLDHLADGLIQANKNGPGNDIVPDVEFSDLGDRGKCADIAVCESVACGYF